MVRVQVVGPNLEVEVTGLDSVLVANRGRYGGRLICAHFRAPVLCIELDTYPYHELILSVPGPADAAAQIQRAVAAGGR